LYFGFCVSDVGYGFILTLICFFVLKKFSRTSGIPPKAGKMGPQGLRFFRLFFLCGISTIIIGALTGSWFGNMLDVFAETNPIIMPLKNFKDSLIMLDPMKEPTRLLAIALSFGIVQVWFGNIVAIIGNAKNRRFIDIFLDQIPMLTLLFGLTGMGLIFLRLLGSAWARIFKYATLIGAITLILTQGRTEKGVGAKLFFGAYNLYNALSGYLSDILSYSRLWALGLVTGVMATTINLISIQFSQIFVSVIPFVDKVAFLKILVSSLILVIIFIFGHLVSFLMNLLGAFVHPVRLQFVEFFSKFFKSGGRPFKPFRIETKYINIK
jgi:V/A-type H+-transporting ATPase subunit I